MSGPDDHEDWGGPRSPQPAPAPKGPRRRPGCLIWVIVFVLLALATLVALRTGLESRMEDIGDSIDSLPPVLGDEDDWGGPRQP